MDFLLNRPVQVLLSKAVTTGTICYCYFLHLSIRAFQIGILPLSNHFYLCLKVFHSSRLCLISLLEGFQCTACKDCKGEPMQKKWVYTVKPNGNAYL